MVIKNPATGLDAAIAVMRKLGKGDPVAYLRALNWHDLGKQAAGEVTDKINGLRDALKEITDSFILRHTLPDEALAGMQTTLRQLDDITPKITQGMRQTAQNCRIRTRTSERYELKGATRAPLSTKYFVMNLS